MHKHVGHPGTWQQFLKRTDNIRIPIEEARQKYLKEQFYYDRWMATSQPALYGAGASAGSNAAFVGQGLMVRYQEPQSKCLMQVMPWSQPQQQMVSELSFWTLYQPG
jgi:K+-transporting ATPase c subunit